MKAESIIKQELSAGPRTAKQLVDACAGKKVKRSTVFYHLKKMRKNGTVRKVGLEYELIKLEEADQRKTAFLMEKITDRNQLARKAAIEDFAALCRERKITNYQQVLPFIKNLLKNPPYPELTKAALRFLRFITVNSTRTKDARALEQLAKFKELLEMLVLNEKSDQSLRYDATIVLDVLLNDNEIPSLIKLLEHIIRETAEKPEGVGQPFQVVGLYLWQTILKRTRFLATWDDIRKWLYHLLEHENRRVREMSLRLLDELRLKEYGFELWPLSTKGGHAENIS